MEIRLINPEEMKALVEHYNDPWLGNLLEGYKYLCKNENGTWTAADNTDGECYTEEFDTEVKARFWLEQESWDKQAVEDYFSRTGIEEGCKDFLVDCSVTLTRTYWCRAIDKDAATRIIDRAWNDGLIQFNWDDDPANGITIVEQPSPLRIEKGETYFRETTDGTVEEVVQK